MSIIIKGINILPHCEGLIFTDHSTVLWADDNMQIHEYEVIQIPKNHGRLKDFDADGVHPIIVNGEYMIKVDDLGALPTILEAEE